MRVVTAGLGLDLVILAVCLLAVFPSLFTLFPSLPSLFFPDTVLYERIELFLFISFPSISKILAKF